MDEYIWKWVKANRENPPEDTPILTYDEGYFGISIFKKGQFLQMSDTGYYSLIIRPSHYALLPEQPKED